MGGKELSLVFVEELACLLLEALKDHVKKQADEDWEKDFV